MAHDDNEDINGFLDRMRDAFRAAAAADTGAAAPCFRRMFDSVSKDFDRARDMAARGERAAAIRAADDALRAALDDAKRAVPPDNLPGRQAYNTLAFRKLTESTRLGVAVTERLSRRVTETMKLFGAKTAPPAEKPFTPPTPYAIFPFLFSGRRVLPYQG